MRGLLPLLLLVGCEVEDDPCAGRRDLLQSEAGLGLTAEEHPMGWGRAGCFQCHPAWTFHTADCVDGVAVDLADIEAAEPRDCVACHGANGVPAWLGDE